MSCPIAVLGLGTMGRNLALNIADHGFDVAIWNRSPGPTEALARESERLVACASLEDVVARLAAPRCVLLMVPAGPAVDELIDRLVPHLAPGDLIIDGGNSFFEDTQRRAERLVAAGLELLGLGVSGGEEGARNGPSLMPGGSRPAFERVKPILEAIAARTESGPCVTYLGPDGSGHFVKMVHNGIEYADMQLIAETSDVLRRGLGLTAAQTADVFEGWNAGPLASYLVEITARILRVMVAGVPLVDRVVDQAEQKGTGRWAVRVALDLGVAVPTIAAAVDARVLSADRRERLEAAEILAGPDTASTALDPGSVGEALLAARVIAYAQGMRLIQRASEVHAWDIDLSEVARIWKAGCIIRARLLDDLRRAWTEAPALTNLVLDSELRARVPGSLRELLGAAQCSGIPVPAFSASLAWYDTVRSPRLPTSLIQAQRDAFGAHGYRRTDDPSGELTHSEWLA